VNFYNNPIAKELLSTIMDADEDQDAPLANLDMSKMELDEYPVKSE
jgi:5-methylcytosine-specific restriction endonuclease McrBC GTP-binding regulatory subunit McrB